MSVSLIILLLFHIGYGSPEDEFCSADTNCAQKNQSKHRYLLYDVNPPEGFNLRRDVYMRFAVLAKQLNQSTNSNLNNFKLVLPPWSHLVHWTPNSVPEHIPWALYFDKNSLKKFAPVIDMWELFSELNEKYVLRIDEVYILQHFEDMFETGNFVDRYEVQGCSKRLHLNYFFYDNITSDNIKCISFHGPATKLSEILEKSDANIILIHHAEVALHKTFGNKIYWMARRSMRFSQELVDIAADFRKKYLNSDDMSDNTVIPRDWLQGKPRRNAVGGPYLAVHLRRRDFVRVRPDASPTLDIVARKIDQLLEKLELKAVFIATDASNSEYRELKSLVEKGQVFRYQPNHEVVGKYKDGGVAIIDQIICSHGRYFVGTHESTFTYRIQEEREIIGFPVETTFNRFCKDEGKCEKPAVWKIVY